MYSLFSKQLSEVSRLEVAGQFSRVLAMSFMHALSCDS